MILTRLKKLFNSPYISLPGLLILILLNGPELYAVEPQFKGYIENRLYLTMLNNDFTPSRYKRNLRWGIITAPGLKPARMFPNTAI